MPGPAKVETIKPKEEFKKMPTNPNKDKTPPKVQKKRQMLEDSQADREDTEEIEENDDDAEEE